MLSLLLMLGMFLYMLENIDLILNDEYIKSSPSVGSQLHSTQQEVLVVFRGQHLLLLPVLLGYHLLRLCFLAEKKAEMEEIDFISCSFSFFTLWDWSPDVSCTKIENQMDECAQNEILSRAPQTEWVKNLLDQNDLFIHQKPSFLICSSTDNSGYKKLLITGKMKQEVK